LPTIVGAVISGLQNTSSSKGSRLPARPFRLRSGFFRVDGFFAIAAPIGTRFGRNQNFRTATGADLESARAGAVLPHLIKSTAPDAISSAELGNRVGVLVVLVGQGRLHLFVFDKWGRSIGWRGLFRFRTSRLGGVKLKLFGIVLEVINYARIGHWRAVLARHHFLVRRCTMAFVLLPFSKNVACLCSTTERMIRKYDHP